jgi:predicted extracellular nuclease
VIGNHSSSKQADEPLIGRRQPPELVSEPQGIAQAQVVRQFVDALFTADPLASVIVLGDLNDFAFSRPVAVLKEGGTVDRALHDLLETLRATEQYADDFVGNAQSLDHLLVSPARLPAVVAFDVVHVNAEFADQASDHDPELVQLRLPLVGTPVPVVATPLGQGC